MSLSDIFKQFQVLIIANRPKRSGALDKKKDSVEEDQLQLQRNTPSNLSESGELKWKPLAVCCFKSLDGRSGIGDLPVTCVPGPRTELIE